MKIWRVAHTSQDLCEEMTTALANTQSRPCDSALIPPLPLAWLPHLTSLKSPETDMVPEPTLSCIH
jgi:hypothetical protein